MQYQNTLTQDLKDGIKTPDLESMSRPVSLILITILLLFGTAVTVMVPSFVNVIACYLIQQMYLETEN